MNVLRLGDGGSEAESDVQAVGLFEVLDKL